jgi:HEAT repeat protein
MLKRGDVQQDVAQALGEIGDERAVEPLAAVLKDIGRLWDEELKTLEIVKETLWALI